MTERIVPAPAARSAARPIVAVMQTLAAHGIAWRVSVTWPQQTASDEARQMTLEFVAPTLARVLERVFETLIEHPANEDAALTVEQLAEVVMDNATMSVLGMCLHEMDVGPLRETILDRIDVLGFAWGRKGVRHA